MEPLYATSIPVAPAPAAPAVPGGGWLSRSAAAAYVGPRRAGRPTSPETIGDWMMTGLRGVRLQFEMRGSQYFTRAEWIDAFFTALRQLREQGRQQAAQSAPPSPRSLERRYAKANEQARKAGIA